jgi:uncharacterized Zn finger protein (UPF0148 family)
VLCEQKSSAQKKKKQKKMTNPSHHRPDREEARRRGRRRSTSTARTNDDDANALMISSKLFQGLRLTTTETDEGLREPPPPRSLGKFTLVGYPKFEGQGKKTSEAWSEDDDDDDDDDDEGYLSSCGSFDRGEDDEDYSYMNAEWSGTQMMDLDTYCASIAAEVEEDGAAWGGNHDDASQKIAKRLMKGWSLAKETCGTCDMPMMRRTSGGSIGEVVCVGCEENRKGHRFHRPARFARADEKPRPPIGTKAFAQLHQESHYYSEEEEPSPTSVL